MKVTYRVVSCEPTTSGNHTYEAVVDRITTTGILWWKRQTVHRAKLRWNGCVGVGYRELKWLPDGADVETDAQLIARLLDAYNKHPDKEESRWTEVTSLPKASVVTASK